MSDTTTSAASSTGTAATASSRVKSKMSDLNSEDFLKIMLQELQQQDPFEPVSSKDLISQVGQIRDIQSSVDLSTTLKDLAVSQKLSAAGTFIGKEVTGLNSDGDKISGLVSSIAREDDNIYLELDTGEKLDVGNVLTVNNPKATATTDTSTTGNDTSAATAKVNDSSAAAKTLFKDDETSETKNS
jgi:flagellar basal-body rod modification protein FlgD